MTGFPGATGHEAPWVPSGPDWRVTPGTRVDLSAVDTRSREGVPLGLDGLPDRAATEAETDLLRGRLKELQVRLFAEHRQGLLLVLQAMDTGGKDGTTRKVFSGVNPQGCQVRSFRAPSDEERDHDFLWRVHAQVPGAGMIGVFNRSHYEDVLVARVRDLVPGADWAERYRMINDFEWMLTRNGTRVLKVMLHISRDEQAERLRARLADPAKHWKFDPGDLAERGRWDAYQQAYADAVSACSTEHAPWHVVPADRKWYRTWVVTRLVVAALEEMNPQFPPAAPGLDGIVVPD